MNLEARRIWEKNLFMGAYDEPDVTPFDRVKYGVLNVMYDYRGVARTEAYGDSYFVLKDVRLRCTFSPKDSANLTADKLAVLDYFAHELLEYTDAELKEVIRVATSPEPTLGDSCVVGFLQYKEAQIHGEVDFSKHVDRLVADDRHKDGYLQFFLKDACARHGIKLSWISEEKERMEQERMMYTRPPDREDTEPPSPALTDSTAKSSSRRPSASRTASKETGKRPVAKAKGKGKAKAKGKDMNGEAKDPVLQHSTTATTMESELTHSTTT